MIKINRSIVCKLAGMLGLVLAAVIIFYVQGFSDTQMVPLYERAFYVFGVAMVISVLFIFYLIRPLAKLKVEVLRLTKELTGKSLEDICKGDELQQSLCGFQVIIEAFRKQIEGLSLNNKALDESFFRANTIIDFLPVGIVVIGSDTKIKNMNKAAAVMFEVISKDSIIGELYTSLLFNKADEERYLSSKGKNKIVTYETDIFTLEGTKRHLIKTIVPLSISNEDMYMLVFVDITERKTAENSLRNVKLSCEAEIRRLQDSNSQLAITVKQVTNKAKGAELENKSQREFITSIAQELRTKINIIVGAAVSLLDTELTKMQQQYIETIKQNAGSLLCVITDIQDFSKVERGKLSLYQSGFELINFIEQINDTISLQAEKKGLEYFYHIEAGVYTFLIADQMRLRQVLISLLHNAIKYTKDGEVLLDVSTDKSFKENNQQIGLTFKVIDTGTGISTERACNIFDLSEPTTFQITSKYYEQKLSLPIIKRFVELMGGQLGVDSGSTGTTFYFTTVFKKLPAINKQYLPFSIDKCNVRALIVDNNRTNRRILKDLLQSWHLAADDAPDANTALVMLNKAAEDSGYTFVIIDSDMPDVDGKTLARMVHSDARLKGVKIIMLRSQTVANKVIKHISNGDSFNEYLTKPVKYSALYACVSRAIDVVTEQQKVLCVNTQVNSYKHRLHILVVDDNLINQEITLTALNKYGFTAQIASNGKEAIALLGTTHFDLVLMDTQMPVMDGLESTRYIRGQDTNNFDTNIPIIAMVTNTFKEEIDVYIKAGMNDYIVKPIDMNILLKKLIRWTKPKENAIKSTHLAPSDTILPTLPGISVMKGLGRTGNDREKYINILNKFYANNIHVLHDIKKAINAGDYITAQKLVYSVKGLSGSIGAEDLFQAANELETAIRVGHFERFSALLDDFLQAFEVVLNGLLRFEQQIKNIDNNVPKAVSKVNDIEGLENILNKLLVLIDKDVAEAFKYLVFLKELLKDSLYIAHIAEIETNLLKYDSAAAKAYVHNLAQVIGVYIIKNV
ncbi:MAG: response regulator [Candidatus Magnetoovum sp. WYHC-5]|nr:response regulator [Candidatus Magnetoovum sp. WYHC-5]